MVLQPCPMDPNNIRLWVSVSGSILCADQMFIDLAGWSPNELTGKPFNCLGVDPSEFDRWVMPTCCSSLLGMHARSWHLYALIVTKCAAACMPSDLENFVLSQVVRISKNKHATLLLKQTHAGKASSAVPCPNDCSCMQSP